MMSSVLSSAVEGYAQLRNATVPACLLPPDSMKDGRDELMHVDLEIINGRLKTLAPGGSLPSGGHHDFDLDHGMVLPALVDMHTHLDKGHIWPRQPNPNGTFEGALAAVDRDRSANWSAEDLRMRMEFSLRVAYVHGTAVIRTHLDSLPPQDGISWPVFQEIRADWRDKIKLQAACLFGIDRLAEEPAFLDRIADRVASAGGVLGAVTFMVSGLDRHLDAIFAAASERGLALDFHADETKDPKACSLRLIAEAALRIGFEGQVVCGHCCSLAMQTPDEVDATLDLVAKAGIGVVSLPMCNMYLQDRATGRTPRWRGTTLLHEMRNRGIPVAVASDNTRDPFYAYGDLDLIEVYTQATRVLQLDHPVADWITSVARVPAALLGEEAGCLKIGAAADLILFRERNWSELLSRPHAQRDVLRKGRTVMDRLPDYRELDHLMSENGAAL